MRVLVDEEPFLSPGYSNVEPAGHAMLLRALGLGSGFFLGVYDAFIGGSKPNLSYNFAEGIRVTKYPSYGTLVGFA